MFAIRARVSCSVALKLAVAAGGTGGQVIVGLTSPVLLDRVIRPLPLSDANDRHFLIIVLIDFRFIRDLIRCRLKFDFKPIVNILSCSSNMVAEGIGRQASGAVARRRRATLLVYR